jgi:hypothetical protein
LKVVGIFGEDLVATALVEAKDGRFSGQIDLTPTPTSIRKLFEEYEEIVNGQMFSFLDGIEERIADLALKVVFVEGREGSVEDLQIYPNTGRVSFRVVQLAPVQTRPVEW